MSTGISNVITFFTNLPGQILSAVAGFATMLVSAGESLISGLVQGLVNDADKVGQKLLDIAKSALKSVLSFFGISSPSKVFAGIGSNLMLGLAQGIDASASNAHASMMKATGALVGGVNATVSMAGVNGALTAAGPVNPTGANTPGVSIVEQHTWHVGAGVNHDTIAELEAMLARNNRDLIQRIGALR